MRDETSDGGDAESRPGLRPKQRAFLAAYRECGTIAGASRAAEVGRRTHYEWLGSDPAYRAAFADAREEAGELLEAEARRRALDGVRRMKFGRDGKPLIDPGTGEPYVEHEYSDVLLIFLLKGAMPEKYRERAELNVSGKFDLSRMSERQVAERAAALGINRVYRLPHEPGPN
ncbi:MAG TPA: hypothetical protein VF170_01220 [Planctomycetaceae bacterium]